MINHEIKLIEDTSSSSGMWLSKANKSMIIQVMLLFWETLHLYFIVYKYTHPPPPEELKQDLCEASDFCFLILSAVSTLHATLC